ncbi:MAG: hypothetical protein DRO99_01435 [Candidatus Aenigmatarchaeota archaeon]|nr:MAG: hypothetical protein DRO99_01435 [Candidatus Aenigmarchaeota archaeon]
MEHPKKIITSSIVIVIFVLLVTLSSWYVWSEIYFGNVCSCTIPLPMLIPVLASIGLLTGTLFYYIMSPKNGTKKINRAILLKMLDKKEAAIVDALLDNRGEITQSAVGSLTGLSKVNVFRTAERLARKGMIEKEQHGKTNMLRLSGEIMDAFC